MKKKLITITILVLFIGANIYGQEYYQNFVNAGFKVKCGCSLYVNNTFISMAKQQGAKNILAAYICAENENDPDIGVIYNINIYDDKLTWTHVSDLKFWNNQVSVMYGIQAIPQNFLIDPQGKIIGKNLRAEALNQKLQELFK